MSTYVLCFTPHIPPVLKLPYKVCAKRLIPRQKKCMATLSTNVREGNENDKDVEVEVIRRSAIYQPNQWDYNSVQFINNNFTEEKYGALARDLKEEVRALFHISEPVAQVKLIDTIDKLGLGYHFEDEIKVILNDMMTSGYTNVVHKDGLHTTSVLFRLLRQYGFMISEDIFKPFMNDESNYRENLLHDVKGLISLYQASHLSLKGESILEVAKAFSVTNLRRSTNSKFAEEISYTMDIPSHWRPKRLEARRYIDIYDKESDTQSTLLLFAKLDFNMVQNIHQSELAKVTNWWMSEGFANKLKFARERTFENFFGAVIIIFQPQFRYIRERLTKILIFVSLLDDTYDIYGSLEELEIFTHIVNRWEIKELEKLPNYMKIIYKAITTIVDETACDIQKHNGLNIPHFLQKTWADLCKSYLVEAKWQNSNYTPTLTEYINNGVVSISGPLNLTHVLFHLIQVPNKEDQLESSTKIIRLVSIIFRLCNDLATSTAEQQRGDAPKAIQCYMKEKGVSEVMAHEHISGVISETWKELNKEYMLCTSFPRPFVEACVNYARIAICIYQHGDEYGTPTFETKSYIQSVLIKPISFIGKDFAYQNLQSMLPKKMQ